MIKVPVVEKHHCFSRKVKMKDMSTLEETKYTLRLKDEEVATFKNKQSYETFHKWWSEVCSSCTFNFPADNS